MTRTIIRRLLFCSLVLILVSGLFLSVCAYSTEKTRKAAVQRQFRETYGMILLADHYEELDTEVLSHYPDILSVVAAYNEADELEGYVIEVKTTTPQGEIHTQMSISEDGETLMALRVIEEEGGLSFSSTEQSVFNDEVTGARIPIALASQMLPEIAFQMEYDSLPGLRDGTYYAQTDKPDDYGYRDYVEITVTAGRIVRVVWDADNEVEGMTRQEASINGFYTISGDVSWAQQAYTIANRLVVVQDPLKLAVKSDGTTEIIDGVTMNVRTFVQLADECILHSREGFTKDDYLASIVPQEDELLTPTPTSSPTPTMTSPANPEDDPSWGADSPTPDMTMTPTPTPTPTPTLVPTATPIPTDSPVIGGEDGVIIDGDSNVVADSIDGLPFSEIRTQINGVSGNDATTRAAITTVNMAYKFMREYLNWVG